MEEEEEEDWVRVFLRNDFTDPNYAHFTMLQPHTSISLSLLPLRQAAQWWCLNESTIYGSSSSLLFSSFSSSSHFRAFIKINLSSPSLPPSTMNPMMDHAEETNLEGRISMPNLMLSTTFATETEFATEFSLLLAKIPETLDDLGHNDTKSVEKAVESIKKEIEGARCLINCSTPTPKHLEKTAHSLGRSLGLVLFATTHTVSPEFKTKIGHLHKELMALKFNANSMSTSPSTSSPSSQSRGDLIVEEFEEASVYTTIEDIVLQLKFGNDEKMKMVLLRLNEMVATKKVDPNRINEEGVIQILLSRLNSSKSDIRLSIIRALRNLAFQNSENKEKMVEVESLSAVVKSLIRGVEERREAVGLLVELSEVQPALRRIGRIQGCVVMLVAMLNGDDPVASVDANKLLNALSTNIQNVLHMAEAGFFKPLVQQLKKGSDMSKILMATALSRMELTDQSRASLGEDGAIDPLVKLFISGKLEAKLSALNALQNLSSLQENIAHLVRSGIVAGLLQLLFSVTSSLMTLREPASAILAKIAESESILFDQDVAQQMLLLLNLSSPVIQNHLLQASHCISAHSKASKVRKKMIENGAIQLLVPYLMEENIKMRNSAVNILYTLSKDFPEDLAEQFGETYTNLTVRIIFSSPLEGEKAAAAGILSNLPMDHKKTTDVLKRSNLVAILVSIINSCSTTSTPASGLLVENSAGILMRLTNPADKKFQIHMVEQGGIPLLVKLLSIGTIVAKSRAATSLAQLSKNSLALSRFKTSQWLCFPSPTDSVCQVHRGYCSPKNAFCLVKACAVPAMIRILEGKEREADEAVLGALATLLGDEICENGSRYIAKMSGVEAIIKVIETGDMKAKEKAVWMLERIFRVEEHRMKYGAAAQVVLIDLAQNIASCSALKSNIAKLLSQLELLQVQSSYF